MANMRVKMTDTTRLEGAALKAGDVVDVPEEFGKRLVETGVAEPSDAKTTAEEQAAAVPPPAEPAPAGYPAAAAAEASGEVHAITREDVAQPAEEVASETGSAPRRRA
jgi:hypothetical protein